MNQFPPSPQSGPGPGMGFPFSGGGFQGPGPGFSQPPQTGTGGLLSRFLGGGGTQAGGLPMPPGSFPAMQRGAIPGFPQQAGMLSRFLPGAGQGGMDMMGMIQNVQKVMQAADTIKPMVQQYGPMVKQLPEMIALFKEYQKSSGETENDEDSEADETPKKAKKPSKKTKGKTPPITNAKKKSKPVSNEQSIKSKPKLYV